MKLSPSTFKILGLLLIVVASAMLIPGLYSALTGDGQTLSFLLAILSTVIPGAALFRLRRDEVDEETKIRKHDSYLIVTVGWLLASLFGSLPYLYSGVIPGLADAWFETMSGFTTTGATVLSDLEAVPDSVLLWRSMTQWIGGMGIIVLSIAILPLLGIGGMELFASEAPGPKSDKLTPRIKETAKRLWGIYVSLTLLCAALLLAGGMSAFDAINHALTTLSSGGFGTHNESIAAFSQGFIHWTLIVFMFLAGTNFTLLYFLFRGKLKKLWYNGEFKLYGLVVLGVVALLTFLAQSNPEHAFSIREIVFTTVSLVTTTGFVVIDHTEWMPLVTMVFSLLLVVGASAGSTSGGIKIVRHMLLAKNTLLEPKRLLHPRAVIPVRYQGNSVAPETMYNVQAFIVLYFGIAAFSILFLSVFGLDGATSVGAVLTSIGNVGPGLGEVGPANNFAGLPAMVKVYLSFLMILGRLELFTVLIVLTPVFWTDLRK